jgi:hypothetical protein
LLQHLHRYTIQILRHWQPVHGYWLQHTSVHWWRGLRRQPPLVVDWAIGFKDNEKCAVAKNKPESYACISNNSKCFDSVNGPGYICNCTSGFQGNPYQVDGCEGNESDTSFAATIIFFACLCTNERNRMLLNLRGVGSELGNLKP